METKKLRWIDETMSSADTVTRVPVSVSLRNKLEAIPTEIKVADIYIPMRTVWLAAASILILISLNIATIRKNQKQAEVESVSTYFEFTTATNELL